MKELQIIKKAIILYTAVTVLEKLLNSKTKSLNTLNFNSLYPLTKKRQSTRSKRINDLMGKL